MECMNVARGDRRKVTDGMRYPFGVASLGNTIYYTDWQRLGRSFIRNIGWTFLGFPLIFLILFDPYSMQRNISYTLVGYWSNYHKLQQ